MIKSWDYLNEYKFLKYKIDSSITKVLKSGTLFFGDENKKFEKNFLKINKSKYGVAVGSGTDALILSLKALNIGINDEVITVANTAIPTAAAIKNVGAKIKFIDVGPDYLIDVKKIQSAITKKTKAIIPVHLYGQACEMNKIINIAKEYKLKIIEDCAQAQGAEYDNIKVGNFGDTGCFSFYPTKIFGAYGDGGFITTNDEKIHDKVKRIRFLGMEKKKMSSGHWNGKYYAVEHGTNSRLDEVHAAILLKKFKYLDEWIERRRELAFKYDKELKNTSLEIPAEHPDNKHAYYIYVVKHRDRDKIISELVKKDIHLNISYPWPIHIMDAYKHFECGSCNCSRKNAKFDNCNLLPETELSSKKVFSLPMYPTLTDKEQDIVIEELKKII